MRTSLDSGTHLNRSVLRQEILSGVGSNWGRWDQTSGLRFEPGNVPRFPIALAQTRGRYQPFRMSSPIRNE